MLAAGKRKRRPICAEISDTPHASKEIIHNCGVGAPNHAPPAAPVKATRSSFTPPSSVTSSGSPSSDLFRKLGEKDDFLLGEGDVAVPEGLISPPAPAPVGLRAEKGDLLSPPNLGGVRPKNKHKAAMGKHATTSSSSFGSSAPNRAPPATPVKATRSSFTAPSSVTSSGSPSIDLFRKLGEKDDFQLGEGDVAVPEGLISPPAPDPVGLRAEKGGLFSPPNFGGVRPKNKHKAAMGKHATTSSSSFGSTVSYVSHPSNEVAAANRQRSERKGPSRPQDTALADASSAMTWLNVTKMNALLNQKHLL